MSLKRANLLGGDVVAFVSLHAPTFVIANALTAFGCAVGLKGLALVTPVRVFCIRLPFCATLTLLLLVQKTRDLIGLLFLSSP